MRLRVLEVRFDKYAIPDLRYYIAGEGDFSELIAS